jgi:tetratricopeptide (TPR) repeat protein
MTTSQCAAAVSEAEASKPAARPRLINDPRLHFGAIVAIALIPRLAYLAEIHRWPFFYSPVMDSQTQYGWASVLVQTFGIGNKEVLGKAPAYAYFLALAQVALGDGKPALFGAHLVQLLLGAATAGMVYLVGRRVFSSPVGIAAGLIFALYSPAVYREGQLLDTALATFLAVGLLLAVIPALDRPTGARWVGTGVLLGLLGLTRPNLLLLALPVAGVMLVSLRRSVERRELLRMVALFGVGIILPIVPITVRNYVISGELIPISSNGGINVYTGNHEGSDGFSPIPAGIAWERTWYEARREAGALSDRQRDAYYLAKAKAFWRDHPGAALALLVKKNYLYWNAYEIPNNVSYDWGRAHSSVLRGLPFTFAIVGPLGLLGIALGGWRGRNAWLLTLFVITQVVAVTIFFVCGRYRMPALPALSIFAAFALFSVGRMIRGRRLGALAFSLAGLAAAGLLVNSDFYGVRRAHGANRDWYYLGRSYVSSSDLSAAAEAFQRAAAEDPSDADALAFLGQVERARGNYKASADAMRRALQAAPDYTSVAKEMADLYLDQGWPLEEPERLLRRALTEQEGNAWGLLTLARINVHTGALEEAAANLAAADRELRYWHPSDRRTQQLYAYRQQVLGEAMAAGAPVAPQGM